MFARRPTGNPRLHNRKEDAMTEQPDTTPQPSVEEDDSRAGVGKDPARPGGGRTEGETAVDEAMGQGTAPEE
jgi:hypothetical protein